MVFSSLNFIIRFLPIFLIVYTVIPVNVKHGVTIKNFVLLAGSLFFYAYGEPLYVYLMLASILANYGFAIAIDMFRQKEKNKTRSVVFICALLFNIAILGFFKYAGFLAGNINTLIYHIGLSLDRELPLLPIVELALPVGISFYTFQIMAYVIDVYRGRYEAEKNILSLGTYIAMFPQLIAGPIVKYETVSDRLKKRRVTPSAFDRGVRLFVMGLAAKVIIANQIGMLWGDIERIGFESISTPYAWLGAAAYSFQIYYDFYGYSLMAIGLGLMLGFRFPKNFNNPYLSKSASEFWQRWHITLGSWFREYVYIPLGGNRKGKVRMLINMFVVWALTGLWHGAAWNFVIWGMMYFVILMVEKLFLKKWLDKSKVLCHIYMAFVIMVSWVVFAISDLRSLAVYLSRMFPFISLGYESNINSSDYLLCLGTYHYILIMAILFLLPWKKLKLYFMRKKRLSTVVILAIFVISVYYLSLGLDNPFLYFRF